MLEYRALVDERSKLEAEVRATAGSMFYQRARQITRRLLEIRDRMEQLEQTKSVGQLLGTRRD